MCNRCTDRCIFDSLRFEKPQRPWAIAERASPRRCSHPFLKTLDIRTIESVWKEVIIQDVDAHEVDAVEKKVQASEVARDELGVERGLVSVRGETAEAFAAGDDCGGVDAVAVRLHGELGQTHGS